MNKFFRFCPFLLVASGFLAVAQTASAFEYFGYGVNQALKWGSNDVGTPGGIISWSIMPDGTQIDASFTDPNFSGTSNLTSVVDQVGGMSAAFPIIERVFQKWSAVSDIQFVYDPTDDGSAFASVGAVPPATGHIRIGAFAINGFVGAVGYARLRTAARPWRAM